MAERATETVQNCSDFGPWRRSMDHSLATFEPWFFRIRIRFCSHGVEGEAINHMQLRVQSV